MSFACLRHALSHAAVLTSGLALAVSACSSSPSLDPGTLRVEGARAELVILETTDVHVNLAAFDYFKDAEVPDYGLAKVATLVKRLRAESPDAILVDDGDLLQGNPLGDVEAVGFPERGYRPLAPGETHAAHRAMQVMGYEVLNLGNHEFNYGLDFLRQTLETVKIPVISANVFVDHGAGDADDLPLVEPSHVVTRTFPGGTVRVAFVGAVPPQIMSWDHVNLDGRVHARDIVASVGAEAERQRQEGADVVIALAHTGIEVDGAASPGAENAGLALARLSAVDAVLLGHAHHLFPGGPEYDGYADQDIDNEAGRLAGKPAVMPNRYGSHLGILRLSLVVKDGAWTVESSKVEVVPVGADVEPDADVMAAVHDRHELTRAYVAEPVGESEVELNTYFARVADSAAVQVINDAQRWYGRAKLAGTPLADLPLLSAAAPFRAGRGGQYTVVKAGPLAIRNIADLYVYPNTLAAVRVSGQKLRDWLEASARNFPELDPSTTAAQALIDPNTPSFNFDVIDGVRYAFDVLGPTGHRVRDLRLIGPSGEDLPLSPDAQVVVMTNNYRAYTGIMPDFSFDPADVVLPPADEVRAVLIEYFKARGRFSPAADDNWRLAPVDPGAWSAPLTFESALESEPFRPSFLTVTARGPATVRYEARWSIAR